MLPLSTNVQEINTICLLSAVSTSSESTNFDPQLVDSMHAEPVYTEVLVILYKRLENFIQKLADSQVFYIPDGWREKEVPELPSNC